MKSAAWLPLIVTSALTATGVEARVIVFTNPNTNPLSTPLTTAVPPTTEPAPLLTGAPGSPSTPTAATGPLARVDATPATAGGIQQARQDFPEQWAKLQAIMDAPAAQVSEAVDCAIETPDLPYIDQREHPCTSYWGNKRLAQVLQYPWRAIGKLKMKEGSWYEGTAQIISGTANQTLIVTAAHNIWDDNTHALASEIRFIPGEREGVAPYGQYDYAQAFVLSEYIDHLGAGDRPRYDVALLTLKPNAVGRAAHTYTGTLGIKWNVPYVMSVNQIGYPDPSIYTKISVGQSFSAVFTEEQKCYPYPTDNIVFAGSTLIQGASGSAWIDSFRPYFDKAGNYVVSVISGGAACNLGGMHIVNLRNINNGPRFADDNIGALCAQAGCVNGGPGTRH